MDPTMTPCFFVHLIYLWSIIYNMALTVISLASLLALLVVIGMLVEWVISSLTNIFNWFLYPALQKDLAMFVKFCA